MHTGVHYCITLPLAERVEYSRSLILTSANNLLGVPVAERFSFCLSTLLCDVASRWAVMREDIILAQIDLMTVLINIIRSSKEHGSPLKGINLKGMFLWSLTTITIIKKTV